MLVLATNAVAQESYLASSTIVNASAPSYGRWPSACNELSSTDGGRTACGEVNTFCLLDFRQSSGLARINSASSSLLGSAERAPSCLHLRAAVAFAALKLS